MHKLNKTSFITKFFTTSLLTIAANTFLPVISSHFSPAAIASEIPSLSTQKTQLIEKLTGQWQLTTISISNNPRNRDPLNFIFTADGKLYVVNLNQNLGVSLEYQVNTSNGQIFVDILQGSFAARTNVDFSHKGQLILQQIVVPAAFEYPQDNLGGLLLPNALFLNRISDDTKLPKGVELTTNQTHANPVKQSEAKTYVGTMNRGQQAFFLEKNYFTSNLEELGLGIKSETENYKYKIVVINSTKAVQNIGLAKKSGLKSYTGLTYIAQPPNSSEPYSLTVLCESLSPTLQIPAKFDLKPEPECPSGYTRIQ